jgi:chemotaxis signal transduction protein
MSPPVRGAAELARDFDRSFAEPAQAAEPTEAFLALAAGGVAYAIRLRHVRGLVGGRTVVPVPSPAPALLGIASARSEIVPVYDLARLLGGEPDRAQPCPWLLLVDAPSPAALALGRFDGHTRLPAAAVTTAADASGAATVQIAGQPRPLLDLEVLAAAIRRQAQTKETG